MYKGVLTSLMLASGLLCGSCGKDKNSAPAIIPDHRAFVVCEGSLGNGNSALTLYDSGSGTSTDDIYNDVNGTSLGDIFQSMTRIGDQYFLCINNSDKVVVVDRTTLKAAGSISISKPRYILPVSDTKAYISTLFSNRIFVINPETLSVTDTIFMPFSNPEGMLRWGNEAIVCTWDTAASAVYAINVQTDAITRTLPVPGKAPQEIVEDKEGMIWILSGNKASGVPGRLVRMDPGSGAILSSYSFGAADPLRLVPNNAKDSLYFIEVSYTGSTSDNGVYRMGIHDATLPATAFIPAKGLQYFWGLGIDPQSGLIYVADPVGFTQRGKVLMYRPDGSQSGSFLTGVGPGHFLFD